MKKKLYKTSEFAALCGVTKHTLYHYDEIGLLKPKVTGDNGYRFYTIEQYEKFILISAFKMLGTPLKEILEYFENKDVENFLNILEMKYSEINAEMKKLNKMSALLSDTIFTLKGLQNIEMGKMEIMDCEEEYLIASPAPFSAVCNDDRIVLECFGEHMQYCAALDDVSDTLAGEMVVYEDIINDVYRESFYISKADKKISDPRLHIKPKGRYAVLYRNGSYDSLYSVYRLLKKDCEELGYTVAGNIYQQDVLDYCMGKCADNYVMKISMHIK